MSPAGRRPGRAETRQTILEAARDLFAEHGFAGTSIRAVARAAAVDPALVPHYFANKEGLFRAALEIPIDPDALVREITATGSDQAPLRLVQTLLGVWDSPDTGPAMVSMMRRTVATKGDTELLRDFFGATVLRAVATALLGDLPPDEARERVTLVLSQVLGLCLLRRVFELEPLASMPADRLAAVVAPTVARYLFGDLTDVPAVFPLPAGPGTEHSPASAS